jgi:Mce-associated membrane protein
MHGEEAGDGAGLARSASSSSDGPVAELSGEPDEPVGFTELDEDEYEFVGEYRARPFWLRTSTLVVLVVLLFVVSGSVTAWLRISDLQQRVDSLEAQTLAAEEARQAAILLATDLATYDYRDLGGNFRHVAANATPRFAGQLRQLTEELGPELQQTRAVATASVRSAGVVRADEGEAVVAVFVDQTVTNSRSPSARIERSRMELTLLKHGGAWRLDQAGEL